MSEKEIILLVAFEWCIILILIYVNRKHVAVLKRILELDKQHAKHLNNIHDFQLLMFDCIGRNDIQGATLASEQINSELAKVNEIIALKKEALR